MIGLIAAVNKEWVLGKTDGSIPWKHRGDQKLFKETTRNCVVIMGRVTWEGIPEKYRPLNDRVNIVISKKMEKGPHDAWIYPTITDALEDLKDMGSTKDIWFIGGRGIYRECLQYCDEVHLTLVPDKIPAADDIIYMPDNIQKIVSWRNLIYFADDTRNVAGWLIKTCSQPHNDELMLCKYTRR